MSDEHPIPTPMVERWAEEAGEDVILDDDHTYKPPRWDLTPEDDDADEVEKVYRGLDFTVDASAEGQVFKADGPVEVTTDRSLVEGSACVMEITGEGPVESVRIDKVEEGGRLVRATALPR